MSIWDDYGLNADEIEVLKPLENIKDGRYAGSFTGTETSFTDEYRDGETTGNKLVVVTLQFDLEVLGIMRKLSKRLFLPTTPESEWDTTEVVTTGRDGTPRTEYDLNKYKFMKLKTLLLDMGVDPEYINKVKFEDIVGLPVWITVKNNTGSDGNTYSNIRKITSREEGEELEMPKPTNKFGF